MKRLVNKSGKVGLKSCIDWINAQKDGEYSVEIKKYKMKTDAQQWYYWGVVLETIANETGYSGVQRFYIGDLPLIMDWKEYLHGIMKWLLQKQTSTTMTRFEYSELIETAIEVADYLWIKVPPPIK